MNGSQETQSNKEGNVHNVERVYISSFQQLSGPKEVIIQGRGLILFADLPVTLA